MGVKSQTFFRLKDGKYEVADVTPEGQHEAIATILLYSFQCMHSMLHILEGFLTSAMFQAAQGNAKVSSWLGPYVPNVYAKMEDVIALLISANPPAVLTKVWEADRGAMLRTMKELVTVFGNLRDKSDFYERFLFKGLAGSSVRDRILREFNKQA